MTRRRCLRESAVSVCRHNQASKSGCLKWLVTIARDCGFNDNMEEEKSCGSRLETSAKAKILFLLVDADMEGNGDEDKVRKVASDSTETRFRC